MKIKEAGWGLLLLIVGWFFRKTSFLFCYFASLFSGTRRFSRGGGARRRVLC